MRAFPTTFDFYPGPPLTADYILGNASQRFFHFSPDEKGLAARLADLGADKVYISCGHQACLLGGPLYVAYKILTAVKLCGFVSDRFSVKAVPLFWLADDDDDVAEVSEARSYQGGRLHIKPDAKTVTGFLPAPTESLTDLPAMDARNWGDYHLKLLQSLFAPMGVEFHSPLMPETQKLRKPFFRAFEPLSKTLSKAVIALNNELKSEGFKPQVPVREGDCFLYRLEGKERIRLGENETLGSAIPLTSALSRLPSLEFSLPLLADVSGPAEMAYHAQTRPLYEALGRKMPVIWPRFSATLIRPEHETALLKAGIEPETVIRDRHKAETAAALSGLPAEATRALERLENGLNALYDEAKAALVPLERTVSGTVDAGRRKALASRHYIGKKLSASVRRRLFNGEGPLKESFDFLYPGALQERCYSFIFFTRSDPDFLGKMLDVIDPFVFKHNLIRIG